MPSCKALISAAKVSKRPSICSMALSESAMDCSCCFCLSSDSSNWASQYSFLLSSPSCSLFKFTTISSTMVITFSKPAVFPWRAKAIKSNSGLFDFCAAAWINAKARAFCDATVTCTWIKLELAPGKVFLKSSSASSSLSTVMVSESASNSSERVFLISSHSPVLVLQLVSSSDLNFSSAASASCVSSMSFPNSAISMPKRPLRSISTSICAWSVPTSFFFADINAS
mmetsp:Transcript_162309/g.515664  ORF Transcript_162309/g.515664 Transcript_162309/m.515664 type:complete len:227 (+) Transcript_162309:347-1027(+)